MIHENSNIYESAFFSNPTAISISTLAEGRFIEVNQLFQELSGYAYHELIGNTSTNLNLWPEPSKRSILINDLKRNGKIENFEASFMDKAGNQYEAMLFARVIIVKGEECLLATTIDYKQGKKTEAELQHSKAFLQLITDSVPALISYYDKDEYCRFSNVYHKKIFNRDPADSQDRTVRSILGDERYQRAKAGFKQALSGEEVSLKLSFQSHLGQPHHFQITCTPHIVDNQVAGFFGLGLDITEKERALSLMQTQRDMATKLSQIADLRVGLQYCLNVLLEAAQMEIGSVFVLGEEKKLTLINSINKSTAPDRDVAIKHGPRSFLHQTITNNQNLFLDKESPECLALVSNLEKDGVIAVLPFNHNQIVLGGMILISETMTEIPLQTRIVLESIATLIGGAIARLQQEEERSKTITALDVLLDRYEEREEIQNMNVVKSIKYLTEPYLKKLEQSGLEPIQQDYLKEIDNSLKKISSNLIQSFRELDIILSPQELLMAQCLRDGHATKEISTLLNLSVKTIESYRNSIRRKLGLVGKKINLRTYLATLNS